mmetsp:Transcript_26106/g.84275  ORF Transcript_26106/g.84275 Transcript_26106/m.84275 type:complete len:203 (+) Transcript_26106:799-1407(+)
MPPSNASVRSAASRSFSLTGSKCCSTLPPSFCAARKHWSTNSSLHSIGSCSMKALISSTSMPSPSSSMMSRRSAFHASPETLPAPLLRTTSGKSIRESTTRLPFHFETVVSSAVRHEPTIELMHAIGYLGLKLNCLRLLAMSSLSGIQSGRYEAGCFEKMRSLFSKSAMCRIDPARSCNSIPRASVVVSESHILNPAIDKVV